MEQQKQDIENLDVAQIVQSNTAFAWDVYKQLQGSTKNLFFSPYSISTALAMAYAGARGETEKQMAQALHFMPGQTQIHAVFAVLEEHLRTIQASGHIQLGVANALWPQQGYSISEAYLSTIKQIYGAHITPVDYRQAVEAARQMINTWVANQTEEKIKDLIKPGVLHVLTRLVLINAIYFKADWADQFDPKNTMDASFAVTAQTSVTVPLMTQTRPFGYFEQDVVQVLEMPYVDQALSMIILLPKKRHTLAEVEAMLSPETLQRWLAQLRRQRVQVFLPRFKMRWGGSLKSVLIALGMHDAFQDGAADFSGIDGQRMLVLDEAIHEAFVDVNEKGTEAAAATAVLFGLTSIPEPPPIFRADHPFIFLIRENSMGSLLFLGRVVEPGSEAY